jgi:hypothetical protein
MLAHDGVIFAESQLFRLIPGVFLGYIEKAGVSCADETDFDSGWLRHGLFLRFESLKRKRTAWKPPETGALLMPHGLKVNPALVSSLLNQSVTIRAHHCREAIGGNRHAI